MKVWICKFYNQKGEIEEKAFDDSHILLDCICETQKEVYDYMFNTCLTFCKSNKYQFIGFEIMAE